jgi:VWFA-related protein
MRRLLVTAMSVLCLQAQTPQYSVGSRLVLVPVTVTDARGHTITGLEPSDFIVLDRDRPRKISVDFADTGVAPIALAVVVQSSGISAAALEKIRKIGSMVQALVVGDRGCAALASFSEQVTWLLECSKDPREVSGAFQTLQPVLAPGEEKHARMLDAVTSAALRLGQMKESRRVILLISESRDRDSETDLATATIAVQRADVTVYAITYSAVTTAFTSKLPVAAPRRPVKPQMPTDLGPNAVNGMPPGRFNPFPKQTPPEQQIDALGGMEEVARMSKVNTTDVLTKRTGGDVLSFAKQSGLESAIARLGEEIHGQYVLSFVPDAAETGYHALDVDVVRDGEFRVRARPGYWIAEGK